MVLALGWIFSNQYFAWNACFDSHHTTLPFQPMINILYFCWFSSNSRYRSNGEIKHLFLSNVDYLEI